MKVALIGIAKDEGPYLYQWINHHLQIGFSEIHIGVNNTSDLSYEILDKISEVLDSVFFENIDWIKNGGNCSFQSMAYAYLTSRLDESVTHVMYLDIDEFWFSKTNRTISEFISQRESFDVAAFHWLCQYGESKSFEKPFIDVKGKFNKHIKSLYKRSSLNNVECFKPHMHIFNKETDDIIVIDQFGNKVKTEGQFIIDKDIASSSANLFTGILHRMYRSEKEYSTLCLRGRPKGDLIKSNGRSGFKIDDESITFDYPNSYFRTFDDFISLCDINQELDLAKNNALTFFKRKIMFFSEMDLILEQDNALKSLNGTEGLNVFVKCFLDKVNNVNALRDFAVKLEVVDLRFSFSLMKKANVLRPEGPFIKRKLSEYEQDEIVRIGCSTLL